MVNTGKDGDYAHPQFATAEDIDTIDDLLSTKDVEHTIRRPGDGKPAVLLRADCPVIAVKPTR